MVLFVVSNCAPGVVAQKKSVDSPVRVTDDGEISGVRKVELSEQRISPTLTMTFSAEIDKRTKGDRLRDLGVSTIRFVSTTGKREYGGGGTEFNFLVDGERVRGGSISSSPTTDRMSEDHKERAMGAMSNGALEEIGRSREVKMKIGDQVLILDKTVIKNIAEFIRELVR